MERLQELVKVEECDMEKQYHQTLYAWKYRCGWL